MLKTRMVLVSLALILLSAISYAEDAPKKVIDGMEAYKTAGFGGAFEIWLKGSPLENDKTTMTNLKGALTQIESTYGKMMGYEILRVVKISAITIRTYAEIRYEKGPLFLYVDCYKTAAGWIVPMMRFHTEADKLLPADIFEKKISVINTVPITKPISKPPDPKVPKKKIKK